MHRVEYTEAEKMKTWHCNSREVDEHVLYTNTGLHNLRRI